MVDNNKCGIPEIKASNEEVRSKVFNDHNITNISIIRLDSTSRLNFHRTMPLTIKILEEELSAIEMNGFIKVGENTLSIILSLMTPFSMGAVV